MSIEDPYLSLAPYYERLRMDWFGEAMIDRLLELLRERGVTQGDVLDAGCGTGTLAMLLHESGFKVTGVDLSPGLLGIARGKAPRNAVEFLHGDITALDLGRRFDAVVSVGDVFNHLPSIDVWRQALQSLARHLRPGGLLFFDALTCKGLAEIDTYEVHDRPDGAMIMGIVYEPVRRLSTMKLTCYTPKPGTDLFLRVTESIPEWGQPVAEIFSALEQAGFEQIERPWSVEKDPERDSRLSLVARLKR